MSSHAKLTVTLPVFHPAPLTPDQIKTARTKLYQNRGGLKADPANLVLEFPDQFQVSIACFGRGQDPRGPYAQPPQAPFLLPSAPVLPKRYPRAEPGACADCHPPRGMTEYETGLLRAATRVTQLQFVDSKPILSPAFAKPPPL